MNSLRSAPTMLIAAVALATGCGQPTAAPTDATTTTATGATEESHGREHGGWWCGEHGVPEEVCARCNSKLAADFQRKGDWCADHERPKSQCFVCDPALATRFAAQYEAKYGEAPPAVDE
jgi:hypothetical protein